MVYFIVEFARARDTELVSNLKCGPPADSKFGGLKPSNSNQRYSFIVENFHGSSFWKGISGDRPASSSSKDLSPILYKIHIKLEAKKPAMKYKSGKTVEIFIFLNLLKPWVL